MTTLHIYRVGQERETREVDLPAEPGFHALNALVLPLLEGAAHMEHVSVFFEGGRADMFVDDLGALLLTTRPPLPANEAATAIYHAASLACRPGPSDWPVPQSEWPKIHGTAVLFSRQVWF